MAAQRIVIGGTTGSGKTTLAARVAAKLGVPHVELDALFWGPDWTQATREEFRVRVTQALSVDAWVVDGNYSKVRDILWERATTVVFLDYPLPLMMWRLWRRSLVRSLRREELWSGNREELRRVFLSRESIIWWQLTTYRRRRRTYAALFADPKHAHLERYRFRTPSETERWLASL